MEDPATQLSPEVFTHVLSMLKSSDLLICTTVSKSWQSFVDSNWLWIKQCEWLWEDKVYVPDKFKNMLYDRAKVAYFESILDSKRSYLTTDELTLFTWNFRFKLAAGDVWINNDPWWNNGTVPKVFFRSDGIMIRDPMPVWNFAPSEYRWRFVEQSCQLSGPLGSFVRVNNFPTYIVSRYKNWGFLMQSCWAFYTSFPMPPKGDSKDLEDEELTVNVEQQQWEAFVYNEGVPVIAAQPNYNPHIAHMLFDYLFNFEDFSEEDDDNEDDIDFV